MHARVKSLLASAVVAAATLTTPAASRAQEPVERRPVPYTLGGGFVVTMGDHGRVCRQATFDEMEAMRRAPGVEVHYLQPDKAAKTQGTPTGGLTILLRGTTQLDSFPQAKAAYVRAAETWEAVVRTQITVVIDVDFGPRRFGQSYPPGVIGSTNAQFGDSAYSWSGVRSRLISKASSQAEADLYAQLPVGLTGVPTTAGTSTLVYIPSAVQRALGLIDPVADPVGEEGTLGDPPAIGFNSAFLYDFDPTNGIDSNKQDFNATALHEIGHALGFDSWTGIRELDSTIPPIVTTWDLFRFRPGVTLDSFGSTQRVLSSGGEQIQFSGGGTTRLSTGRPDGSGGDGNQASHWKDNVQNSNTYIGIMDPTGSNGDLDQLTAIDLATLDLIGYDVRGLVDFDRATGSLTGNTLTVNGVATVANLKLVSASVKLLDATGATLTTLPATALNQVGSSFVPLTLTVNGLDGFLAATSAEVTLFDDKSNASIPLRVDFGSADSGGPTITTLSYNGKKMKVVGTGLSSSVQLEVNGVVTTATIKAKGSTKLNVKGTTAALGLRSGANRVRILSGSLRSNIFVLTT